VALGMLVRQPDRTKADSTAEGRFMSCIVRADPTRGHVDLLPRI